MKVKIIKGEFEGRRGEIVKKTEGVDNKIAGGPTTTNPVTVLVEGILHPVELSESDIERVEGKE